MAKKFALSNKTKKIAFRIAIGAAIVVSIIGLLFLVANLTPLKIPYLSKSTTITDTASTDIKDSSDNVLDCSEIMCPKDICPDGQGRRKIGENCCACPAATAPIQDPLPITTNCQNVICPMDMCPDGKSRRKIGDDCCACDTSTPQQPLTPALPVDSGSTISNPGPQMFPCTNKKCTNAWEDKPGKQQLQYTQQDSWLSTCCQRKKCINYNCTGDYELKPDAESIYGITQSTCCNRKASAAFTPQCQDFCKNPGISLNTKCGYTTKVCSACDECQNWSPPGEYEPIYIGGRPLKKNRVSNIEFV